MEKRSCFYLFVVFILSICSPIFSQEFENNSDQHKDLYPSKDLVLKFHNNWSRNHYVQRISDFKNEPLQFGDIVFIGNSITEQGGDWSQKMGVENIRNRGIAGDLADGVLERLAEIIYFKPKAIFILIGINDLCNIHQEDIDRPNLIYDHTISSPQYVGDHIVEITRILHQKLPFTQVFVRTVLPTRKDFLVKDIQIVNDIIRENMDKGYYKVIDLYSEFVDSDEKIKSELTKDGIHLTDEGYRLWSCIEKPIFEMICGKH